MPRNKNNPANPIIELIRRLGTQLGVLNDIYGNVFDPVIDVTGTKSNRGWWFLRVPSPRMLSLAEVYDAAVFVEEVDFLPMDADGLSDLNSVADEQEEHVLMFITGVQVSRNTSINISVNCENAEIVLYVNNSKRGSGDDSVVVNNIVLQESVRHTVQILLKRKSLSGKKPYFTGNITVEGDSSVIITVPAPRPPEWDEDEPLIYGSGINGGVTRNMILTWKKSPLVKGWLVERSDYRLLGYVSEIISSGVGIASILVSSGTNPIVPTFGLPIFINSGIVGVVDEAELGIEGITLDLLTDEASYTTNLPPGEWNGKSVFVHNAIANIAEIDRKNVAQNTYDAVYHDAKVVEGFPYTYRIYSRSILDPKLLSEPSPPRTALAVASFDVTIAVVDRRWIVGGEILGVTFWHHILKLVPGPKTKSFHIRWFIEGEGGILTMNEYNQDIDQSTEHYIQTGDAGLPVGPVNFTGPPSIENLPVVNIQLTPYSEVGGALGRGVSGIMVSFSSFYQDKREIGIQKHDSDVATIREDAHKMVIWDGLDFPTNALPGDIFILRDDE